MGALPWISFYHEAYTANTMHLTTEEHGAYLLMMLAYYRTEKPLPASDRALAALTKLPMDRWLECKPTLAAYFIDEGTHWRHERIEKELLAASSKHAAAVAKATTAAAAKYGKTSSQDAPSKPQATPKQPKPKKTAPSKSEPSSEHASSTPRDSSKYAHLHIHTTLSNERVVAREGAKHDDAPKVADAIPEVQEENPLGTTLPEDWIPEAAEIATARSYGMGETEIEAELLTFHAYNAQHGTFSKNWSATWGMWCARWKEREGAKPKQAAPRVEVNSAPTDKHWDFACRMWAKGNSLWSHRSLGPEPGQPGCKCPAKFLTKYHIDPATGRVATPSETET